MKTIAEGEYTFRRCNVSDISEISVLVNKVLKANRNGEYWIWKYFKNPAGEALSALCQFNKMVVGQLGAIPVRFMIKGKEFTAAQKIDVALFDDHRRFDTFLKMVALEKELLLKKQIQFSYSFTNELTSEIANVLAPKSKISSIPRLVKILDIKPFFEKKFGEKVLSKILSPVGNGVLRLRYGNRIQIPESMMIKKITRFDKRFDTLWDQIKGDYPIITVRDSDYLNWRYVDATHMNYEIFCLELIGSNDIAGFIILGENKKDVNVGQIFDIITPRTEDGKIASCLVNFAVNHFRKRKVSAVRCWMFAHCHIYPALMRAGFLNREKKGRDFLLQCINLKESVISKEHIESKENWYLTKGDSDID